MLTSAVEMKARSVAEQVCPAARAEPLAQPVAVAASASTSRVAA